MSGFLLTVENRGIVATVVLRSKTKSVPRVLRKRSHEALESSPHIGGIPQRVIRSQGKIKSEIGSTRFQTFSILWTCCVGQLHDITFVILVGRDRNGIEEADRCGFVNEELNFR